MSGGCGERVYMASDNRAAFGLLALAAIGLGSCQLSVPIDVQQLDDGRIAISTGGWEPRPCIQTLIIADGQEEKANKLWDLEILSDVNSNLACKNKIIYPDFPKNYQLVSAPVKLEAGHKYYVLVDGAGFHSGGNFIRRKTP